MTNKKGNEARNWTTAIMFGFGKKEADKQLEEQIQAIQETACNIMMTQFALAGTSSNAEARARARAPYVCGYIFGFVDSLLQLVGVTEEDVKAMAAMTIVHIRLFGEEQGSKIFGESLSLQEHPDFAKGRMRGGQEVRRWLADRNPKGFVPMGLARYLLSDRESIGNGGKIAATRVSRGVAHGRGLHFSDMQ